MRTFINPDRELHVSTLPAILGRGDEADVVLNDRFASRMHCELRREGDQLILRDLESKYGTWINGRQIQEQVIVVDDDILIGVTQFTVKRIDLADN